ncbi:hypothetical protein LWE61_08085 [Sphingobium sufflavum]|uniref:hypothetical protein n=1 Tax=Sphingobium sufflavum TaxID=1129547 RepID=UPI001F42C3A6|nr:hypothetical protein [Sphingobium sufflavum]MCE7796520.1 hypothetical protein [Sphingobium sufflavum]
MTMKAPIGMLDEDYCIALDEADFGGRYSGERLYGAPLVIFDSYKGVPRGTDIHRVMGMVYDLTSGEEEGSCTIVCTQRGHTRGFIVHFPDENHQVEIVPDEDEDEDD